MEKMEYYVTFLGDKVDLENAKILKLIEKLEENGKQGEIFHANGITELDETSNGRCGAETLLMGAKEEAWKQLSYLKHAKDEIEWLRKQNEELQKRDFQFNTTCVNYEFSLAELTNVSRGEKKKLDAKTKEVEDLKAILEQRIIEENNTKMHLDIRDMEYSSKLAEKDEYLLRREAFIDELQETVYQLEYEVMQANEVIDENRWKILNKDEILKEVERKVEELEDDKQKLLEKIQTIGEKSKILQKSLVEIENDLKAKDDKISHLTKAREFEGDRLQGEELILSEARKVNIELGKEVLKLKARLEDQDRIIELYAATGSRIHTENCKLDDLFDGIESQQKQLFNLQDVLEKKDAEIMELEENNIIINAKLNSLLANIKETDLNSFSEFQGTTFVPKFNKPSSLYDNRQNQKNSLDFSSASINEAGISALKDSSVAKAVAPKYVFDVVDHQSSLRNSTEHLDNRLNNCKMNGQDSSVQMDSVSTTFPDESTRKIEHVIETSEDAEDIRENENYEKQMEDQTAEIFFFDDNWPGKTTTEDEAAREDMIRSSFEETLQTYIIAFTTDDVNRTSVAKMQSVSKRADLGLQVVKFLSNKLPVKDGSEGALDVIVSDRNEVQHLSISFDSDHELATDSENESSNDEPFSCEALDLKEVDKNSSSVSQTDEGDTEENAKEDQEIPSNEESADIIIIMTEEEKRSSGDSSFDKDICLEEMNNNRHDIVEMDQENLPMTDFIVAEVVKSVPCDSASQNENDGQDFEQTANKSSSLEMEQGQLEIYQKEMDTELESTINDSSDGESSSGSYDLEVEEILTKKQASEDTGWVVEDTIYQDVEEKSQSVYAPCDEVQSDEAKQWDSTPDDNNPMPRAISFDKEDNFENEINIKNDVDAGCNDCKENSIMVSTLVSENASLKAENERITAQYISLSNAHKILEKKTAAQGDVIKAANAREDYFMQANAQANTAIVNLERELAQQLSQGAKQAKTCQECLQLRERNIGQKFKIDEISKNLSEANMELERVKNELALAHQSIVEKPNIVIIETENYDNKKSKKKKRSSLFCA